MVGDEAMGGEVWGRVVHLWMQNIDRGMRCLQASVSRRGCLGQLAVCRKKLGR